MGRHDIVNCFSVESVEGVTAHLLTVIERKSVDAYQQKLSVATHHSLEERRFLQSCPFSFAVNYSKISKLNSLIISNIRKL